MLGSGMEQNETTPEDIEENIKEITLEDEAGETFKLLEVDKVILPASIFKKKADARMRLSHVKNFPYNDGDILVCSYPKTGTHWTANILHYLVHDGPLDDVISYQPCLIDLFNHEEPLKGRRIFTSHLPPKLLPREHFANGGKTILVYRNPKDTVVSYFHMMQRQKVIGDFNLSWKAVFDYWLEGKVTFGSYFEYYDSWQKEFDKNPNMDVHIVKYEDLKMDSLNEVRRIQKYLGLNHSDEHLKAVLEKCSLDNLKADVESGKLFTKLTDVHGKAVMYRKGIIGDWKNHFTVAQNEKFDAILNENMSDGLFDYKSWN